MGLGGREQIDGCGVEMVVMVVRNEDIVGLGLRSVIGIRADGIGVDPATVVADCKRRMSIESDDQLFAVSGSESIFGVG